MNQELLRAALNGLPLDGIRYFEQIGSTNDEAVRWAKQGAPNLSLVLADEQTGGRGKNGRKWYSPPGASLALSLIIAPEQTKPRSLPRLTALGALAVNAALKELYGLEAQIKWPNDVLVQRQKVCGVLVEAGWDGDQLQALVVGIGINVAPASTMDVNSPQTGNALPAASMEALLDRPVNRLELLRAVLANMLDWLPDLGSQEFLKSWQASLAFHGEWVQVTLGQGSPVVGLPNAGEDRSPTILAEGKVMGLSPSGSLRLRTAAGKTVRVSAGEVHLRPARAPVITRQASSSGL